MSEAPVRVMRIIARLNVGGPALHCLLLSDALVDEGFETVLVTGRMAAGEADYESLFPGRGDGRFRIERLGAMSRMPRLLGDLRSFLRLISLIRRFRPQVVHTHTAKAGALGRLAAWLCRVPVIVHTFHGHVLSGYFGPFVSGIFVRIERVLGRLSSAIITLSPGLRTELGEGFRVAPLERFRVIPLGRDLAPFREPESRRGVLRTELGIGPEVPLIGCVGRLVPIKDHETLLAAFATLSESQQDPETAPRLLIIGDGELRAGLEARARELGIAERVRFLGWRSDLPEIYADLDLVVLSSRNEGTPLSIIEAFASGCPVVSTRVGGVADMFSDPEPDSESDSEAGKPERAPAGVEARAEGALVASEDPTALAEAMASVLRRASDPESRARLRAATEAASARYSAERLAGDIAGLYRELLAGRAA